MKTDTAPAPRMDHNELGRYRRAADRATSLYPGVIGEVLAAELDAVCEFGYRVNATARAHRLAAALEAEQHRRDTDAANAERARVAEVARLAFRGAWGCSASEVHR